MAPLAVRCCRGFGGCRVQDPDGVMLFRCVHGRTGITGDADSLPNCTLEFK